MHDFPRRIARYLSLQDDPVKINGRLGEGTDGAVWATDRDTAIKVFKTETGYWNEKDTYVRLAEYGHTDTIGEFWVPEMQGCDDELMIVEMDIMHRAPFVIDFAKVRLNSSPDFSEITTQEIEEQGQYLFDDNWPRAKYLIHMLETYQIYYLDPKPWNIVFELPSQRKPAP